MSNRETGTLKFFDSDKGFGFIERERGDDAFLHITNFAEGQQPDPAHLDEGARVAFFVVQGDEGPQAQSARLLEEDTAPSSTGSPSAKSTSAGSTGGSANTGPFRVPKDTAPLFEAHREKTRNLSMRVETAVPFEGGGTPDIPNDFDHSNFDAERLRARHDAHLDAVRGRPGVSTEVLRASVQWRLAVGLGRVSVYENGITLDATDGMPYVPGSGLKGALRTVLINTVYRPELDTPSEGEAEARALEDRAFCDLFGVPADAETPYSTARRGTVQFHDAYPHPSQRLTVEADIMNPHFQEYYQGTAAPTDDMNPTIITFLTVTNAAFTFVLSTRENRPLEQGLLVRETPGEHRGSRLSVVTYWLEQVLTEWGLGAKTASGYGTFTVEERGG